jgi:hypothetical protein
LKAAGVILPLFLFLGGADLDGDDFEIAYLFDPRDVTMTDLL